MKTNLSFQRRSIGGYALVTVLAFGAISAAILGASLTRTINTAQLNVRNNLYNVNIRAAEAATELVVGRMMADYRIGGDASVADNLDSYRDLVPDGSQDNYWSGFEFSNGEGQVGHADVEMISDREYKPLDAQYYGLQGWATTYRVSSRARQPNSRVPQLTSAIQQDVELDSIPIFEFAIFYNSLLEFTWNDPMTVQGRTHANGDIYVGSQSLLQFDATVTSTGTIQSPAWAGKSPSDYTVSPSYHGEPDYRTNVATLTLPIGTNNTPSAVREIINLRPPGESIASPMGRQRYYNKAGVVLLVTEDTVTAIIKSAPDDGAPTALTAPVTNLAAVGATFPFLSLTNSFWDSREQQFMKLTQIDMGKLKNWSETNPDLLSKRPPASNPFNILYVADLRTTNPSTNTAVRLRNGGILPTGNGTGFTVATLNPLYIRGNYNITNGISNTSGSVPASVVCDALTILSVGWKDSESAENLSSRVAGNTTVNAAIIAGMVYSIGPDANSFGGGVRNLPRLLEAWSDSSGGNAKTLAINGSLVCLFNSIRAVKPFRMAGDYYYPPNRVFNYDQSFKDPDKLPPGTPALNVLVRSKWVAPPPDTVNYAGD